MSAEDNLANSRRLIEEAWNQGKFEVIDELIAPECVNHDLSTHEEVEGLDAHKERIEAYRTAMPDLRVTIEDAFAGGDDVCMRWRARATNEGELLGNPPTHKQVDFTGMSIDRWEGGKLVEVWDQWDYLGFMQQLGLVQQEGATA